MYPRLTRPVPLALLIALLIITALVTAGIQPTATAQSSDRPTPSPGRPALTIPVRTLDGETPYLTCAYGCGSHQDGFSQQFYAVDFGLDGREFPVYAAHGGVLHREDVTGIGTDGQPLGTAILAVIDYGNGWVTKYAHLQEVRVRGEPVDLGQYVEVQQGEQIGMSGNTGATAFTHAVAMKLLAY